MTEIGARDRIRTNRAAVAELRNGVEVAAATGLGDYRVKTVDNYIQTPAGFVRGSGQTIVRVDGNGSVTPWDVASDKYRPLQNHEALSVFDGVVAAGASWMGAGTFQDGRLMWGQIDMKLPRDVRPGDTVIPYLAVRQRHGDGALRVYRTDVRIICRNTLEHACQSGVKLARIRHTGNVQAKADDIASVLAAIRAEIMAQYELYSAMATKRRTAAIVREVMDELSALPATPPDYDANKVRRKNDAFETALRAAQWERDFIAGALSGKRELIGGDQGSVWDLLNAYTQFADHELAAKATNPELDRIQGKAAEKKAAAYEYVVQNVMRA